MNINTLRNSSRISIALLGLAVIFSIHTSAVLGQSARPEHSQDGSGSEWRHFTWGDRAQRGMSAPTHREARSRTTRDAGPFPGFRWELIKSLTSLPVLRN